jgi:hypothetical protein
VNVLQILRFFLPGENPIGFGLADAIEIFVAAIGVAAILLRHRIAAGGAWLADRPRLAMAVLAILPVALRLALLRQHPVPIPTVPDDFSFLLLGDTLAHFRLANPVHPMHRFFESLFILQEPSYSSIYPPGQGIALAVGQWLGHPWIGVLLSVGVFCGICFWMLRAWVAPVWALCGGLLSVAMFGPLSRWTNDYFGGAVSAIAGCLVFGALPRLRTRWNSRDALLLGCGLGLQLLARPFESLLLDLVAGIALLIWRPPGRMLGLVITPLICGGLFMMLHNHAVTGRWATLPYFVSQSQYGVPAAFTFQPNPVTNRALTAEQQLTWEIENQTHDHPVSWPERLSTLRFFLLPPLFAVLPLALTRRSLSGFAVIILFFAGTAFYPFFYSHYIAAVSCVFLLLVVTGLERLSKLRLRGFDIGAEATIAILILCSAHFTFWYGLHLAGTPAIFTATSNYNTTDYINYGDAESRIAIASRLAAESGTQLVFVRYSAAHTVREWVHNAADIDHARIVWALDLGPDEDRQLRQYYPRRKVWLLEADTQPPRLSLFPEN